MNPIFVDVPRAISGVGADNAESDELPGHDEATPSPQDSHFQLPIRRPSTRAKHSCGGIATNQNLDLVERGIEIVDDNDIDSDSDNSSSQLVLTPDADSINDEEADIFRMVEDLSSRFLSEQIETLHEAIIEGRLDAVKSLCRDAIIEQGASDSYTPLIRAIIHEQLHVVRYLLDRGGNIHHSAQGLPPIIYAVLNATPELIQMLMNYGADPDRPFRMEQYNALHFAALHGKVDAVDFLVSKGVTLEATDGIGRTALLLAAGRGETVVVKVLLAKGAEIRHKCSAGRTALIYAALNDHLETVKYLLEQGLSFEDSDDATVALHVEDMGMAEHLSRSRQHHRDEYLPCGNTPLTFAVGRRSITLIQKLLDLGHDTSKSSHRREGESYTPLVQALVALDDDWRRDTSVVDALLNSGKCKLIAGETCSSTPFDYLLTHYDSWDHGVAEVMTFRFLTSVKDIQSDRSDDGSTLLHAAVRHRRTDLIETLLSRGADMNAKDNQGRTVFFLECANSNSSTRFLRTLISHGANPHTKDVDGQGALHAAASAGHVEIINILLNLEVEIDAVDNNGYMPFAWAILSGQEDAALYLLIRGANVTSAKFRRGRTALHTAVNLSMSRLVPVLLHHRGSDINARDDRGFTPLALACRNGDSELIRIMIDAGAE